MGKSKTNSDCVQTSDKEMTNVNKSNDLKVNHLILNSPQIEPTNDRRSMDSSKLVTSIDQLDYTKSMNNSNYLMDETADETYDFASNVNRDENAENLNNQQVANAKAISKVVDKLPKRGRPAKDRTAKIDDGDVSINAKKRKLSTDERPVKKRATRASTSEVVYLFVELQLTGFNSKEDIVKFCVLQDSDTIGG